MEIILIILTSVLMGAINVASFFIGYLVGKKHQPKEGIVVNNKNKNMVKQLANLLNYTGDEQ